MWRKLARIWSAFLEKIVCIWSVIQTFFSTDLLCHHYILDMWQIHFQHSSPVTFIPLKSLTLVVFHVISFIWVNSKSLILVFAQPRQFLGFRQVCISPPVWFYLQKIFDFIIKTICRASYYFQDDVFCSIFLRATSMPLNVPLLKQTIFSNTGYTNNKQE